MKKIIVTVTDSQHYSYELELPTEVSIAELCVDIAEAINKANMEETNCPLIKHFVMYSKRNGEFLMLEDTLQSAGVYSGDTIIIQAR